MSLIEGVDDNGKLIIHNPTQVRKQTADRQMGTGNYNRTTTDFSSGTGYWGGGYPPFEWPDEGGGGGGGGGGGYSSSGGSSSRVVNNWFLWWYGYEPSDLISQAKNNGWTEDDVRRAACDAGINNSPGMTQAKQVIQQIGAGFFGGNPSAIPPSLITSLIKAGYDVSYLENTYFPMMQGGSLTNPKSFDYIDMWVQYTGRPIGPTAAGKLDDFIRTYGYGEEAQAAWENFVKNTESAYTGNYGATHRAAITTAFNTLLGRNPTADELGLNGGFWDLNQDALTEQILGSAEGRQLYANKPAYETPEAYLGRVLGLDQVLRWYYGDHVVLNDDGSLDIYTGEPDLAKEVTPSVGIPEIPPFEQPPGTTPDWKSLTNAKFKNIVGQAGISVVNGEYKKNGKTLTPEEVLALLPEGEFYHDAQGFHYVQKPGAVNPKTGAVTPGGGATDAPAPQWKSLDVATFTAEVAKVGVTYDGGKYMKDGKQLSNDELMALLPPDTFYYDSAGFHYVQDYGATNPKTGQPATVTRPAPAVTPTSTSTGGANTTVQNPFANLGLKYVDADFLAGIGTLSPQQLMQQFQWLEEADYLAGTEGKDMVEAFGTNFSSEDWYKIASGAKGSGAMRAQLMEAKNRVACREVYRDYFGTDPSPADYDALTSQFVSPGEFAHRMAAKESAKAQIEQVNDVLGRVFGRSVGLAELENLAMGGQGSGELQAMIDQATRLEQYRWLHKQYYGDESISDDYAKYAGYASASQLQWEIVTQEKMAEYGDDINEAFTKAYGYALSDEQLKTMLGEMEGYGELNKLYKQAKEEEEEGERARKDAMYQEKVTSIYTAAPQGGIKEGLPGLEDLT